MRRHRSVSRQYFEELYRRSPDPWNFATSVYEQEKYAATLQAIGSGFGRALEVGCSIGVFTRQLAERCKALLAVDIAEAALRQARARCADLRNVRFQNMELPATLPRGRFDLVVLSDVGGYWTLSELDRFTAWVGSALNTEGACVLVHWTGKSGDRVHDRFAETVRMLRQRRSSRAPGYRLEVWIKPRDGDHMPRQSAAEPAGTET
jgi:predicted TPR repeat methyltransferase